MKNKTTTTKEKKIPKTKNGRPSKLNDEFLDIFRTVVKEAMGIDNGDPLNKFNAIFLDDDELRMLINEKLEAKDLKGIPRQRFQSWKAGKLKDKDELLAEFHSIYKKAMQIQKQNLFLKMATDEKAWQRFAWIIERKFEQWRMKYKFDHTSNNKTIGNNTFNFLAEKDILKEAQKNYEKNKKRV